MLSSPHRSGLALVGVLCLLLRAGGADASEASPPATETAPPPDEATEDPLAIEAAYQMLRPVTTLGWTFTAVGLTLMGVGLAAQGKVDLGPLPTVGGVLFMSSLFVTSVVGSQALRLLPTRFRGRPARMVSTVAFAIGMGALVADAILRLLVFELIVTDAPLPLPLTVTLQAVGFGGLITASLTTQVDNSVLLGQLARERRDEGAANGVVASLAPAPLPGGGALLLIGRF